jgi:hypothetical protein
MRVCLLARASFEHEQSSIGVYGSLEAAWGEEYRLPFGIFVCFDGILLTAGLATACSAVTAAVKATITTVDNTSKYYSW